MAKIIVGVDGSDHAKAALEWAVEEARLRGASLTAVYAYPPNPADFYGYPGAVTADQLRAVMEESDRQAQKVLSDVLAGLGQRAEGLDIETDSARGETPPRALVERSKDADLLVVGSRGRGGLAGMLLGSVSQQTAQHAHCPVVIVGSGR